MPEISQKQFPDHIAKHLDEIKASGPAYCPASTSAGADHALCSYAAIHTHKDMVVHLKTVHGVEEEHRVRVKQEVIDGGGRGRSSK
jgi:hypothetical protein